MTRIGFACALLALSLNAQQPPWPDPSFPFGAVYFRGAARAFSGS